MQEKRLLIAILGSVQGVGFRPFVFRLANQHGLSGHIRNTGRGVDIDVQGDISALATFQKDLITLKPERAQISEMKVEAACLQSANGFEIKTSESSAETLLPLLPDSAICHECLQELSDPSNRRYRYPFLHCMTCGPRFSLFVRMPFDRENTAMADFSMCSQCLAEYSTPSNRRFYSQTNCCPECGPELRLQDPNQRVMATSHEAILETVEHLRQGKIVALKNTGGFLLLVDAINDHAVSRLRLLKRRVKKPFAVLMPDLPSARKVAFIDQTAERILTSAASPIVLLKKLPGVNDLSPSVTFESPYYGIMLPHNAMQHLLMNGVKRPLVATSANISGMPLCITEEEAFHQLGRVADFFLTHNRAIMHRLDDSVVQIIADRPMIIRRSRGYIPYAIDLAEHLPVCILASGSHLKNSFAFAKDRRIYMSQYIGNLDTVDSAHVYDSEVKSWETLLNITPSFGVCDKHPDYYTSRYLQMRKIKIDSVQHHKAHVFSGMLDNQLSAPLLGLSWDGTGLGDDHTIWGGEAFIVTENDAQHFASLYPFRLPGSEKAIREPRRSGLGVLYALFGSNIPSTYQAWLDSAFSKEELSILAKGINAPVCSSMGRLFDAVSALLNCCLISQFEGHAALALEALALRAKAETLPYPVTLLKEKDIWLIDWRDMIKQLFEDKMQGMCVEEIALAFHLALVQAIVQIAQKAKLKNVLLTGGVMQNKLLAESAISQLRKSGFNPFWHHQIPPNDSGLAVGQIMGALHVSCVAG